jgi:hypothetical protein
MAMYAAAGVGALCISSSVAAVMMNVKKMRSGSPSRATRGNRRERRS